MKNIIPDPLLIESVFEIIFGIVENLSLKISFFENASPLVLKGLRDTTFVSLTAHIFEMIFTTFHTFVV